MQLVQQGNSALQVTSAHSTNRLDSDQQLNRNIEALWPIDRNCHAANSRGSQRWCTHFRCIRFCANLDVREAISSARQICTALQSSSRIRFLLSLLRQMEIQAQRAM